MGERNTDALDAARYRKLRGWMSSNVPEGWQEVKNMGALCAWVSWEAMDAYLDGLPECNVGLMSKRTEHCRVEEVPLSDAQRKLLTVDRDVSIPGILDAAANSPCEANCAMCNGRGFYGIPGGRCSFCDGKGKVRWWSMPTPSP